MLAAKVEAAVAAAKLILLVAAAVTFEPTLVQFDVLVVMVDPRMGICLSLSSIISTQESVRLR
jgi:hypothetical protein